VLCVDYLTLLTNFFTTPAPVEAHEHDKKDPELKYETFTTSGGMQCLSRISVLNFRSTHENHELFINNF